MQFERERERGGGEKGGHLTVEWIGLVNAAKATKGVTLVAIISGFELLQVSVTLPLYKAPYLLAREYRYACFDGAPFSLGCRLAFS